MGFGTEYPEACISTFSTPVRARAPLTAPPYNNTVFEYQESTYLSSLRSWSVHTISYETTLTTGVAIADPVVVAWQAEDYSYFPSKYASSLLSRFAITIPTPTPGPTTNTYTKVGTTRLSTAARVGIAVGSAIGALTLIIVVILLFLKRRRYKNVESQLSEPEIPEMQDQDRDLANKKWWIRGRWRNEVQAQADPQELENTTVNVVPGPPAELDGEAVQSSGVAGRSVIRD